MSTQALEVRRSQVAAGATDRLVTSERSMQLGEAPKGRIGNHEPEHT